MNILAEEKNVHRLAYAVCRSVDVSVAQCMDAAKDALRLELNAILSSPGKDGGQEVEAKPICYLVWRQGRRAIDDVEDYYEVARPGDKSVDGSDPFPVFAQPASTALVEAARFLADRLEDFRQKIDDIDDEREFEGHIIPALARLRSALSSSQSTCIEGER